MSRETTHIYCSVPEAIEAEVMQCLNRFGGKITSIEREALHRTGIGALIAQMHVADFKAWLHSYSRGQGSISKKKP